MMLNAISNFGLALLTQRLEVRRHRHLLVISQGIPGGAKVTALISDAGMDHAASQPIETQCDCALRAALYRQFIRCCASHNGFA